MLKWADFDITCIYCLHINTNKYNCFISMLHPNNRTESCVSEHFEFVMLPFNQSDKVCDFRSGVLFSWFYKANIYTKVELQLEETFRTAILNAAPFERCICDQLEYI